MNRNIEKSIQCFTQEVLGLVPMKERSLLLERTVREVLKFLCDAVTDENPLVSYVRKGEGRDGYHEQLLRVLVEAVKRNQLEFEKVDTIEIGDGEDVMLWFVVDRNNLPEGWHAFSLGMSSDQILIMGSIEGAEIPCLVFDVIPEGRLTGAADYSVSFGPGRSERKYYRDAGDERRVIGYEDRIVGIKDGGLVEYRTYYGRVGEIELNKSIFDFLGLGFKCAVFCFKE